VPAWCAAVRPVRHASTRSARRCPRSGGEVLDQVGPDLPVTFGRFGVEADDEALFSRPLGDPDLFHLEVAGSYVECPGRESASFAWPLALRSFSATT